VGVVLPFFSFISCFVGTKTLTLNKINILLIELKI